MKIGIIQGTSQKDNNTLIYEAVKEATEGKGYEVINFGVFKEEESEYSYVETAMLISILLDSKAVDFIVTGCSSGQGMMLACNSLPSVLCGFITSPSDAYLFGRINNGNAISLSLGLNFGWAAEINLKCILERLFHEEFGVGYPKKDADRKRKDTLLLKEMNSIAKKDLKDVILEVDKEFMKKVLSREVVIDYVKEYGENKELLAVLNSYVNKNQYTNKKSTLDICNFNKSELITNIDKLQTTELGIMRIKRNLSLEIEDVVQWCKFKIKDENASITRKGKNWYIAIDNIVITVNAYSFTIITAHRIKK